MREHAEHSVEANAADTNHGDEGGHERNAKAAQVAGHVLVVAATGKANRGMLRHSEPVVMSMCLDTVSAIRSQSLIFASMLICADDDTPNTISWH